MNSQPFDYGEAVRVIRNIRNDGTFPGADRGQLLVRRGSIGYMRDRGTFLQDQIIYSVHFPDENRLVGCRDQEVQAADSEWIDSRFDHRDRVRCSVHLAVAGEVRVRAGSIGEVMQVHRQPDDVRYEVLFAGPCTLLIPEARLEPADESDS